MNHSMINSMVSMQAIQQKLDVLGNNMANLNTNGFKRKEASFEDILTNIKQQPRGFQQDGRLSPLGFNQGWGAKLSQVQLNFSQGTLSNTGNPTDLAIEGDGLFEIAVQAVDEQGNPVSRTAYTRDGAFDFTVQANDPDRVYLATKEGHLVMGNNGPIAIPKGYKAAIDGSGQVTAYNGSRPEEGGQVVGQIRVLRAIRPQYLQQMGTNLYTVPATVDPRNVLQDANANPSLEQPIAVRQGFLEQSNVNIADEMTQLTTTQRAFQLSSRALTTSDTMMELVNNLRK